MPINIVSGVCVLTLLKLVLYLCRTDPEYLRIITTKLDLVVLTQ